MAFRYALLQIAAGVQPNDTKWIDPTGRDVQSLGDMKSVTRAISESDELLSILAETDLSDVAKRCKFPDFLGYLGVALFFTSPTEFQHGKLTEKWTPQLLRMVIRGGQGEEILQRRIAGGLTPLSWQDLEAVEKDFDHSGRHSP